MTSGETIWVQTWDPMEPLTLLTVHQKTLLRQSWNYISQEQDQVGLDIFEMIFRVSPNAKRYFRFPPSDYENGGAKSAAFKFHSMQFMQAIEMSLSKLDDDLDELRTLLHTLGACHRKVKPVRHADGVNATSFSSPVAFNASYYWAVFDKCALDRIRTALEATKLLNGKRTEEAMTLWRVLLLAISNTIKEGFQLTNADLDGTAPPTAIITMDNTIR